MTASAFAGRHQLPVPEVTERQPGLPSQGVKAFVEDAAAAVEQSEAILTELQDSLSPVEVGDAGCAQASQTSALVSSRCRLAPTRSSAVTAADFTLPAATQVALRRVRPHSRLRARAARAVRRARGRRATSE